VFDLTPIANALPPVPPAETVKESKPSKLSGSGFVASNNAPFSGFGMMSHAPFYDSTDYERELGGREVPLLSHFSASVGDLDQYFNDSTPKLSVKQVARVVRDAIVVYNDLSKVSETKSKSCVRGIDRNLLVQNNHLDRIAELFGWESTTSNNTSLKSHNCSFGLVTEGTVPDAYIIDQYKFVRGLVDVKSNVSTPAEAIRQGVGTATNVALGLVEQGVPVNDIAVPVIGSNGYLFQFAIVYLLYPSFPVTMMISSVLDATDDNMLLEIARLMSCIHAMLKKQPITVQSPIHPLKQIAYSSRYYHAKSLEDFFCSKGNAQNSLLYLFKVFSRLHKNPACKLYVVFPLCVREYEDNPKETEILFPNLEQYGYKIGLPRDANQRQQYLSELRKAMVAFHNVGVAHIDLYLSNIMWKVKEDGNFSLKVIDWDVAHFLEEPLSPLTVARLTELRRDRLRDIVAEQEGVISEESWCGEMVKYFDISLVKILEGVINEERLQSDKKSILDVAFSEEQAKFIQNYLNSKRNFSHATKYEI